MFLSPKNQRTWPYGPGMQYVENHAGFAWFCKHQKQTKLYGLLTREQNAVEF